MRHRYLTTKVLLVPVVLAGTLLASCSETSTTPPTNNPNPLDTLTVPATYSFKSRFDPNVSSVSYEGQIVRQLLIQDLKTFIDGLAKSGATPVTMADLLRFYEHKDEYNMTTLTAPPTPVKEGMYNKISTGRKLSDKVSPDVIVGMGKSADALIREYFQKIVDNSNDPSKLGTAAVYTDANGVQMSQMINKILLSALVYYQGTNVYLNAFSTANNTDARTSPDKSTAMEHIWDEGFGYFGAARDYANYTIDKIAGPIADYTFDTDGDGKIDLTSEFNFYYARDLGKRDKEASSNLRLTIFEAFRKGRAAITAKVDPQLIIPIRNIAVNTWEKALAANVLNYLSTLEGEMANLTNESNAMNSTRLNSLWGEMKGFAIGLQYNPNKLITDAQIQQVHSLLGTAPVYAANGTAGNTEYKAKLNQVRQIFKTAYGFTDAQLAAW